MHYTSQLLFALTAASAALAGPLESRTGLVKRMFWCNGRTSPSPTLSFSSIQLISMHEDSHVICPPGERIVLMEPASCQVLRDAGRLNDASPPENGEQYYDCGRDDSGSGSGSGSGDATSTTTTSTTSTTSATSTPTPPPSTPEQPAEEKAAEAPSGESHLGAQRM